jgi:multiple sugar transport system substrate-binding protein
MNRRNFLTGSLLSSLPLAWGSEAAFAQLSGGALPYIPEADATLEVFRWKRYIEEDEEQYMANVKLFTKATGVKVNVKHINILELFWAIDDVYYGRKHADIVLGIDGEAYRYKNLWMQVNDLEKSLTPQIGKWDPIANALLQANGKDWMGIPLGVAGNSCYQRTSYMKQAGFSKMPEDAAGFLELCKSLKSMGKPAGFALYQSRAEGGCFAYWMLWAFGGYPLNKFNQVSIESAETLASLEYAKKLYRELIPGCIEWGDVHNNQFYLNDQISLTYNGMNIYGSAVDFGDEMQQKIIEDTRCGTLPKNNQGQYIESGFFLNQLIHQKTKFPNAAKAFIYFMMQPKQYAAWITASQGFISAPCTNYDNNPIWQKSPILAAFQDAGTTARPFTWGGIPGLPSHRIRGNMMVAKMFADVIQGKETPRDAMRLWANRMEIIARRGDEI